MCRVAAFALGFMFVATSARADDSTSPENVILAVKRSTVFIQAQAGAKKWSGSGFVAAVAKDALLIATNYHVVAGPAFDPKKQPTPSEIVRNIKGPALTVVFDSGTKSERSFKAEAIAADAENDLAVLRVADVKDPPDAINYASPPKLIETMPVYTFGFPFGKSLAVGKGSPAITVGKASISSIRLDDNGDLSLVQIDGGLNPGNSGGPIVDAKGRLVGVAVATIKESSGIGLAVPAAELGRLMKGRLGGVHVTMTKTADGKIAVKAEVAVIDPNKVIGGISLHYLAVGLKEAKPAASEKLEKQPGVLKLALKRDGGVASGEITLETSAGELFFQAFAEGGSELAASTTVRKLTLGGVKKSPVNPVPTPKVVAETSIPNAKATRIQGGGNDPEFNDVAPEGALLVGFEIGLGKFFNNDIVKAIRPIYRAGDAESLGAQQGTDLGNVVKVVAKPGYAVGAITLKTGLGVDGVSATFMKIDGARLDAKDAYESDWVGGMGGAGPVKLSGGGIQAVGLTGRWNRRDVNGLGLIFDRVVTRGKKTAIVGFGFDADFIDPGPEGAALIGFEVGLAKSGNNEVVRSVRPIYKVGDKELRGEQRGLAQPKVVEVIAKPGYAVGALNVVSGLGVDGFSVIFMKMTGEKLDPKDNYEGEWLGCNSERPRTKVGGDGTPSIGLLGKTNKRNEFTGIGLFLRSADGAGSGKK